MQEGAAMNQTEAILKIIEAEKAAKSHLSELEEKKVCFAGETKRIIEAIKAEAYKNADAEIERRKAEFARSQTARVEKEKKKCAEEISLIERKKKDSLETAAEECFREIVGG